jgi:phosphomannomutase
VRESEADVGFAQDPDADRLALIDEQGRYVGEEYTLALGAMALLEARARQRDGETAREGNVLVTNLSTSRMLEDVAARYGARVIRTAVGEANVVEVMKREKALAGGEGNGGVIWPRVTYVRDSLGAMALTLWLLSPAGGGRGHKRALSELIASIPAYAIEKRKFDLACREDAAPAIEKIAAAYKGQFVDRQDGAWVDFRNGPLAGKAWLHVRASNTEPIMRLIAEAPTSEQATALLDEAARTIA